MTFMPLFPHFWFTSRTLHFRISSRKISLSPSSSFSFRLSSLSEPCHKSKPLGLENASESWLCVYHSLQNSHFLSWVSRKVPSLCFIFNICILYSAQLSTELGLKSTLLIIRIGSFSSFWYSCLYAHYLVGRVKKTMPPNWLIRLPAGVQTVVFWNFTFLGDVNKVGSSYECIDQLVNYFKE